MRHRTAALSIRLWVHVSLLWEIGARRNTGSMGDNWSDGYGKYRDRKGTGNIGKGPKHSTTHIRLLENRHPPSPPQARHQSPIPPRDTKQFPTHPKPHTTKEEGPLALEVELIRSAESYRTTGRQQSFDWCSWPANTSIIAIVPDIPTVRRTVTGIVSTTQSTKVVWHRTQTVWGWRFVT